MSEPVPLRHLLLAILVVAVWGVNFVVIKAGLDHLPPLLFAALRFTFAFFPVVFFIPRPGVPWRNLISYGLFIGVGQFGFLYIAINGHISPGLASLVAQTNAFFTIGLAMVLSSERVRPVQVMALLLAVAGIGVILTHTDGSTTPLGLALVILAAFSWACGNIASKNAGKINMVAYVAWSSGVAIIPLIVLSLVFEGWDVGRAALLSMTPEVWGAVLYQSWGNSLFGFAVWGWLLVWHPAASIAPLSLLVPVFGMGASALLLGEPLPAWKLIAAALVMGGLALNVFGPRLMRR
jgi:O-acetylserine/cysteine efflux transporter